MFGHDDNNQQQPAQDDNPAVQAVMPESLSEDTPVPVNDTNAGSATGAPTMSAPHIVTSNTSSVPDAPAAPTPAPTTPASDDLLSLKQQALQHLSPLVGQLDQTPEEKFRTTM